MAELHVPLLVILGAADSIVPPRLSLNVFEAANQPKRLVEMEGLDHNDPGLASGANLAEEIRMFVDEQVAPQGIGPIGLVDLSTMNDERMMSRASDAHPPAGNPTEPVSTGR